MLVQTAIGGLGALAVLLFVYGSAIAIVPLLIAVPAILATFLPVLGLTYAMNVSYLVEYLIAVMGLRGGGRLLAAARHPLASGPPWTLRTLKGW